MAENSSDRPRVLSGMRPTGKLHLGNYIGALANWVKLQDKYEGYFFIADWHALTTNYADPSRIKLNTLDVALDWLAAGLDPERSTVFIQSHVLQHAELNLLLGMMTPLGWLERVPTYKEQQENLATKDLTNFGFLGYPVLMASDILLYQAQYVPVGQDQTAHVELTREVARRFNSMYKTDIFPEPEALYTPSPKLSGLDGRKMSKSYGNTLGLTEAPASITAKISAMSTGGQRIRQSDGGDPELCPVTDIHRIFSAPEMAAEMKSACQKASIRCEDCKRAAAASVCATVGPIYEKRMQMENNIEQTWEMLRASSAKAAIRAEQTMVEVREIFDLSHELGTVKRYFGVSAEDPHDLSQNAAWWNIEDQTERARNLRDQWQSKIVPREVQLSQDSQIVFSSPERELEEPFLTARKKRVFVAASRDEQTGGSWEFEIPAKSYEVWTLLAWQKESYRLHDFILPQKVFSLPFSKAKKSLKKDEKIPVTVRKEGDRFLLSIHGSESVDITELLSNYEPLQ